MNNYQLYSCRELDFLDYYLAFELFQDDINMDQSRIEGKSVRKDKLQKKLASIFNVNEQKKKKKKIIKSTSLDSRAIQLRRQENKRKQEQLTLQIKREKEIMRLEKEQKQRNELNYSDKMKQNRKQANDQLFFVYGLDKHQTLKLIKKQKKYEKEKGKEEIKSVRIIIKDEMNEKEQKDQNMILTQRQMISCSGYNQKVKEKPVGQKPYLNKVQLLRIQSNINSKNTCDTLQHYSQLSQRLHEARHMEKTQSQRGVSVSRDKFSSSQTRSKLICVSRGMKRSKNSSI